MVAIVLFGGVSIFGGRGTIIGVVLSAAIVAALQMALTQMNVDPNVQDIVIGGLLLISVIIPNVGRISAPRPAPCAARRSRQRRPITRSTAPPRPPDPVPSPTEK